MEKRSGKPFTVKEIIFDILGILLIKELICKLVSFFRKQRLAMTRQSFVITPRPLRAWATATCWPMITFWEPTRNDRAAGREAMLETYEHAVRPPGGQAGCLTGCAEWGPAALGRGSGLE